MQLEEKNLSVHIRHMGKPWWVVRTKTGGERDVVASGESEQWCAGWLAHYLEDPPIGFVQEWAFAVLDGKAEWEAAVEAARAQRGTVAAVS